MYKFKLLIVTLMLIWSGFAKPTRKDDLQNDSFIQDYENGNEYLPETLLPKLCNDFNMKIIKIIETNTNINCTQYVNNKMRRRRDLETPFQKANESSKTTFENVTITTDKTPTPLISLITDNIVKVETKNFTTNTTESPFNKTISNQTLTIKNTNDQPQTTVISISEKTTFVNETNLTTIMELTTILSKVDNEIKTVTNLITSNDKLDNITETPSVNKIKSTSIKTTKSSLINTTESPLINTTESPSINATDKKKPLLTIANNPTEKFDNANAKIEEKNNYKQDVKQTIDNKKENTDNVDPKVDKSITKGSKDTSILVVLLVAVMLVGAAAFTYNFLKKRRFSSGENLGNAATNLRRSLQSLTNRTEPPAQEMKPLIHNNRIQEHEMIEIKSENKQNGDVKDNELTNNQTK